jgi:type IV pilus assembly protein PilQ
MMSWLKPLTVFTIAIYSWAVAAGDVAQQISVNFPNIQTRDLLHLLTEHSGKNVIISEKVSGKISVNLHKTPWREALDIVLQMRGLVKRETANVIFIAPISELDNKELQSKAFNLSYASADSVSKMLGSSGLLSSLGKAGAETRTNKLVVADNPDKIEALKNLLQQVDVPINRF